MSNDRVDWKLARIFAKRIDAALTNENGEGEMNQIFQELTALGANEADLADLHEDIYNVHYESDRSGWNDGLGFGEDACYDYGIYEGIKEIIRTCISEQN